MYATVYASDYDLSAIRVINIHHLKAFKKNFARRDTHDVIKPKRLKIGENVPFVPLPPPQKKPIHRSIINREKFHHIRWKRKKKKRKKYSSFSLVSRTISFVKRINIVLSGDYTAPKRNISTYSGIYIGQSAYAVIGRRTTGTFTRASLIIS